MRTKLPTSLSFRLLGISIGMIIAGLLAAGLLLVSLFQDHIEKRFDHQLRDHLEELVAAGKFDANAVMSLNWTPSDPRFNLPFSGWYWQINDPDKPLFRSKSLVRSTLDSMSPGEDQPARIVELAGPENTALRVLVQDITFPASDQLYSFVVAGPLSDISKDVRQFTKQLSLTLLLLSFLLIAMVFVQIRYGLSPLKTLRSSLGQIRSGHRRRLPSEVPDEVQPVVQELNALLELSDTMLKRAHLEAGNLAHALKTPLTVVRNELAELDDKQAELLKRELDRIHMVIGHHLARSRARGPGGSLGARTVVAEVIEDLRFSMDRLYLDKNLGIELDCPRNLVFAGDRHDLEEMVGNLMDNACKWAISTVAVRASMRKGLFVIRVEDDGPGIGESLRAKVLERGQRLDEKKPGSGIGLSAVRDLAKLYGGSISLSRSPRGGLAVTLTFPHDLKQ